MRGEGKRLGHLKTKNNRYQARNSKAYYTGEGNAGSSDQVMKDFICHMKGFGLYPITEKFNGASGRFALILQELLWQEQTR